VAVNREIQGVLAGLERLNAEWETAAAKLAELETNAGVTP
jgi:hypothetical protein